MCSENVHETHGVYILVSFVPRLDVFILKSIKVMYWVQLRAPLFQSTILFICVWLQQS